MRAFKTVIAICLSAVLMSAQAAQSGAQMDSSECHDDDSRSVEGTWKLSVDRIGQGVTFNVFMSFTAGGVVVATGSLDKLENVSTVFGSWKPSSRNSADVTIYFFLFDPSGNPVGTLKTNETFRVSGKNKLTGTGLSYTCDVAGENCGKTAVGEVSLVGTKIRAEGVKN
jgi:hypothetical protein